MGRRLNALLEICLVYILILLVPIIIFPTINWLFPNLMYTMIFGQFTSYPIIGELTYLAIVLIVLAVTRRGLSQSGISLHNLHSDLKVAAICIITLCVIPFLPWNLIGIYVGIKPTLLDIAIKILMLFVTVTVLMKVPAKEDKVAIGTLIVIPAMLLPSINGVPKFAASFIYLFILYFVFVGPIEELVYRGYIQSRLNEAFDRPYRFFGISWGVGLIITSLLFGFWHATNTQFNPLIGNYDLDWVWGIETFITGLAFCFIREKTGNITAPAIVHGAGDFLSNIMRYL